jgi:hypothetical protein
MFKRIIHLSNGVFKYTYVHLNAIQLIKIKTFFNLPVCLFLSEIMNNQPSNEIILQIRKQETEEYESTNSLEPRVASLDEKQDKSAELRRRLSSTIQTLLEENEHSSELKKENVRLHKIYILINNYISLFLLIETIE